MVAIAIACLICNWFLMSCSCLVLELTQIDPCALENPLSPMLFFLITCLSFILLSKSFSLKRPLPPWKSEMLFLSLPCFWKEVLSSFLEKNRILTSYFQIPFIMPSMKRTIGSKVVVEKNDEISLLDLPELTLECILERLSPAGLYTMSGVCSSMRNRCGSDHLWEKHVNKKWGKLIGNTAAYREWQWQPTLVHRTKQRGLFGSVSSVWPLSWITPTEQQHSSLPVDSVMDLYIALESGKLWFPAQVYNRENGYVGFMLSSYDAEVSYDSCTDTFRARYSPHWQQTTEENIVWNRLRARAVDTPPHVLHVSDCLNDLSPEDHIEIQWRRKKEFPYGWWYGVVAHLESCNGNKIDCRCHSSERVILEFKQYSAGSQWGKTVINRKEHREIGNEADGFYGGIRKLYHEEEISMWRRLWPPQLLE